MQELWAHQIAGVQRIRHDQGIHALLWQPGAGKSATVVRYLEELAQELGRPVRVLIVVPKSVLGVWPGEFEKHCHVEHTITALDGSLNSRFDSLATFGVFLSNRYRINVALMAYSSFSSKPHSKAAVAACKKADFDVIVLDESHNIKSAQSNTSKLLGKIGASIPRRLILTGTPTPHSHADVYGQWRFLHPEAFAGSDGKMVSFGRWLDGYAIYGGYLGKQVVGWRDLDDMEERIARRSSVVKTSECHDLPELLIQKHTFPLGPAEQKAYDSMRRDLVAVIEDETVSVSTKLVSVLRLRQITSGFLPSEETGGYLQIGGSRRDLAMGLIEDLLASEKRIVVFAWSRHEVDSVADALTDSQPWNCDVQRITGSTSSARRELILKQFATNDEDRQVLVAQVDTLNSGTNALVGCSHVLYLSLTNNAGTWIQSLARFHRPGQKASRVVAHVLQAKGSVDEGILDSLEGRVDMQDALMEHIKEVRDQ